MWWSVTVLSFLLNGVCEAGITSSFIRVAAPSIEIPKEDFPPPHGYNAPEQVHITQGDYTGNGVIVSWVTPVEKYPNFVTYWKADEKNGIKRNRVRSKITTYRYYNYSSGYIHHATINRLQYNTKYAYELGHGNGTRQFWFMTPPEIGPDVPYTFGLIGDLMKIDTYIGDLGQTHASKQTLDHYLATKKGQTVLFLGDFSYADVHPFHDNEKWDTYGRFVEKSNAYEPWIYTAGNHELDLAPEIGEYVLFKPYKHRYRVPFRASGSTSPLWYSIKRASAHIIVLSSYSAFEQELTKVNRSETPWLIVMMHSPMYNSNNYHFMEGETMRVVFEPWFVKYKVDLVLSGHVHSYERSERVSNIQYNITSGLSTPVKDPSAPVYITVGDGGNIEGIADSFTEHQPDYSAFREASFGHALLEIKNQTHAFYSWHRNQDNVAVSGDSIWFYNRHFYPKEESSSKG
ncbi:Iron/zinc purple acid phosphatase-like C-terminal domain-containing protein [Cynara cardunculus var. scolymus]|uniref:Purple acid phosphatase n=1 Tax=Cynara cardunculus var. scolymus TaxID=59895 RepID=A0A103YGQ3_CYNCS|nr:Iron/zinc purple acid phosphatase-like C-terminal domain-containing protein [Cynara cardunculus var. scolymus]